MLLLLLLYFFCVRRIVAAVFGSADVTPHVCLYAADVHQLHTLHSLLVLSFFSSSVCFFVVFDGSVIFLFLGGFNFIIIAVYRCL